MSASVLEVRSGSDGSFDPCTTTSWGKEFPSGSSRYSDKSTSERPTNPNRSAGRIEIQSSDDKHEPKKRSTRTIWLLVPRHVSRTSETGAYARASSTMLNGPSVARRTRVKPPSRITSVSFVSPAWAPRPSPTSWSSDVGTQIMVEAL